MILPLTSLLLAIISGLLFLSLIKFSGQWQEKLGISFLFGFTFQSIVYFIWISYTNTVKGTEYLNLSFFLFANLLLANLTQKRKNTLVPEINRKVKLNLTVTSMFSWSCIIILLIISLVYATYTPVHTTDSIHLYDFRAKVMYETERLDSIRTYVRYWPAYPMFTSMIGLFSRFIGFGNPSFFYPLMYFAFALVFYSCVRKSSSQSVSSLATLIMFSTPITYWQSRLDGLTNLPYTIFICVAIFYATRLFDKSSTSTANLIISSFFSGFAIWTRSTEPFWLIPCALTVYYSLSKRNIVNIFVTVFIVYWISNIWPTFVGQPTSVNMVTGGQVIFSNITDNKNSDQNLNPEKIQRNLSTKTDIVRLNIKRLSGLLDSLKFILPIIISNLSIPLFLFMVLIPIRLFASENDKDYPLLVAISSLLFLLWIGTYYFSLQIPYWRELRNPVSRLVGVFAPLMVLYVFQSNIWDQLRSFKPDNEKT